MEMKISFPGGKKVNAEFKGFTHATDQPEKAGGEGSAPSPFDLFLASIGTCAGFYVSSFCKSRDIDTDSIELIQTLERNPETRLISKINVQINLPEDFPEKYKKAVVASANQCAVKKHLQNPPVIDVFTN